MRWVAQCWERNLLHDGGHERTKSRGEDTWWTWAGKEWAHGGQRTDTWWTHTRQTQEAYKIWRQTRRRFGGAAKADTWRTQGGHMADKWQARFGGVAKHTQGGHKADTRRTHGGHTADTRRTHGGQSGETRPKRNQGGRKEDNGGHMADKREPHSKLFGEKKSQKSLLTTDSKRRQRTKARPKSPDGPHLLCSALSCLRCSMSSSILSSKQFFSKEPPSLVPMGWISLHGLFLMGWMVKAFWLSPTKQQVV